MLLSSVLAQRQPSDAAVPNVVTFLIDDMDLERISFYPRLDAGAKEQHRVHLLGCKYTNCTYSTPHVEGVGERGVRFLGAHVPAPVCTPSRYSVLTGRLPSSSPFYSGTKMGRTRCTPTPCALPLSALLIPCTVCGTGTKMGRVSAQVDVSWNSWVEQSLPHARLPCCGPGVPKPCADPHKNFMMCRRQAHTLGSMLQAARFFTGFVGKWHLTSPSTELNLFHKGAHGKFEPARVTDATFAAQAELRGHTQCTLTPISHTVHLPSVHG